MGYSKPDYDRTEIPYLEFDTHLHLYICQKAEQKACRGRPLRYNTPPHTMSGMPGNIEAADVAPSELPDGFTLAGPGGGAAGGGGVGSNNSSDQAAQQRDAHRQAILEQAMTPEALARLRRVKVGATGVFFDGFFFAETLLSLDEAECD